MTPAFLQSLSQAWQRTGQFLGSRHNVGPPSGRAIAVPGRCDCWRWRSKREPRTRRSDTGWQANSFPRIRKYSPGCERSTEADSRRRTTRLRDSAKQRDCMSFPQPGRIAAGPAGPR